MWASIHRLASAQNDAQHPDHSLDQMGDCQDFQGL
jgi:hypothetical protein